MELDLRLPGDLGAAAAARHAFDGLEGVTDRQTLEDVRLLVSELVTNSLRHGGGFDQGWIDIRVETSPNGLRVEVIDPGPGFEPLIASSMPGVGAGYGLAIVDHLADRWGVAHDEHTKVWFELDGARSA
jgi:anti-sigma regulatory factor (Ser/Thr protein kinase)